MVQETEKEGVGAFLKRAREERNIPLEDVSAVSKINVKLLAHLEAGNYDQLPNPVFVRGYLKAYANYIGIDSKEVVGRFDEQFQSKDKKRIFLAPQNIGEKKRSLSKSFSKKLYWLLFGLVSIVIIILTSTLGHKTQQPLKVDPVITTQSEESQPATTQPSIETLPLEANLEAATAGVASQQMTVQTIKPVWLKIQVDNHPTYSRHLVSNQELKLKGEKEIKVYISDRSAVKLTHNGNLLDYSGSEPLPIFLELNQN